MRIRPFSSYAIVRAPDAGGAAGGSGAADSAAASGGTGGASGVGAAATGPWYASADYGFDDDTRRFFEGKNYPDVKTALTSLRHADQVARDRNVLAKPDPARLNEWEGWKELGWTPDLKDYAIQKPKLKDGQILDEAMFSSFVQDAHELRIPLGAAQTLFERQFGKAYERIGAMDAAGHAARQELEAGLKGKWGDKYEANLDLSKRAMRALGVGMDDSAEIEKMIGSPRLVELFHGFAERIGEDRLVTPTSQGNRQEHPATIEAELNRFEMDPENIKIMNDQRDPRYRDVIASRRKMIERLAVARGSR